MTPAQRAQEFLGEESYSIMDQHLDYGFIYSGSDAFALAMPHSVDLLLRPDLNKKVDKCDCWFVQYVTGDLKRLFQLLDETPHDFKYIVYGRNNKDYKVYELEKLHGKQTKST